MSMTKEQLEQRGYKFVSYRAIVGDRVDVFYDDEFIGNTDMDIDVAILIALRHFENYSENDVFKCEKCGSSNNHCYKEREEWFEDTKLPENHEWRYFDMLVRFFVCNDCKHGWASYDKSDDYIWLGTYEEAFGSEDDWDY